MTAPLVEQIMSQVRQLPEVVSKTLFILKGLELIRLLA